MCVESDSTISGGGMTINNVGGRGWVGTSLGNDSC